ncbi:protein of unknown function [Lachnospiraceae bacterium C7]|nr:protein of unknown function [Lachnospiraceae bacterium C7]
MKVKKKLFVIIFCFAMLVVTTSVFAVIINDNHSGEATVKLADSENILKGEGVSITNNIITINRAGTYEFDGNLSDGQLVVDVKSGNVVIKLNNANITSKNGSALLVKNAHKVSVHVEKNTTNTLTSGCKNDGINSKAKKVNTISSTQPISFSGTGDLFVNGYKGDGISCTNGLFFTKSNVDITSNYRGIYTADNIDMREGSYHFNTKEECLYVKGYVTSNEATIKMNSKKTGVVVDGSVSFAKCKMTVEALQKGIKTNAGIILTENNIKMTSNDSALEAKDTIKDSDNNLVVSNSLNGFVAGNIISSDKSLGITAQNSAFIAKDSSKDISIQSGKMTFNVGEAVFKTPGNVLIENGDMCITNQGDLKKILESETGKLIMETGKFFAATKGDVEGVFSDETKVDYAVVTLPEVVPVGTEISICDVNNNELYKYTANSDTSSLVYAADDLPDKVIIKYNDKAIEQPVTVQQ